ncbi:hypothetical protein J2Z63_000810, partial [Mycoplasma yeatsii]|nr:hypothetical protein [Mycoplasma yeatsii]
TENRSNNSITLTVKDEHIKYQGSITINYSIKTDISTLELNRNAGAFNAYNFDQIINSFISKNPELSGLTKDNFEVVGDRANNSLTVKVKNSDKFQGQITINFTIQKQNNKNIIISSSAAAGGVGLLGAIIAFIRRRKRK